MFPWSRQFFSPKQCSKYLRHISTFLGEMGMRASEQGLDFRAHPHPELKGNTMTTLTADSIPGYKAGV